MSYSVGLIAAFLAWGLMALAWRYAKRVRSRAVLILASASLLLISAGLVVARERAADAQRQTIKTTCAFVALELERSGEDLHALRGDERHAESVRDFMALKRGLRTTTPLCIPSARPCADHLLLVGHGSDDAEAADTLAKVFRSGRDCVRAPR